MTQVIQNIAPEKPVVLKTTQKEYAEKYDLILHYQVSAQSFFNMVLNGKSLSEKQLDAMACIQARYFLSYEDPFEDCTNYENAKKESLSLLKDEVDLAVKNMITRYPMLYSLLYKVAKRPELIIYPTKEVFLERIKTLNELQAMLKDPKMADEWFDKNHSKFRKENMDNEEVLIEESPLNVGDKLYALYHPTQGEIHETYKAPEIKEITVADISAHKNYSSLDNENRGNFSFTYYLQSDHFRDLDIRFFHDEMENEWKLVNTHSNFAYYKTKEEAVNRLTEIHESMTQALKQYL